MTQDLPGGVSTSVGVGISVGISSFPNFVEQVIIHLMVSDVPQQGSWVRAELVRCAPGCRVLSIGKWVRAPVAKAGLQHPCFKWNNLRD